MSRQQSQRAGGAGGAGRAGGAGKGRKRGHSQLEDTLYEDEELTQATSQSQAGASSSRCFDQMDSSVQEEKIVAMLRYLVCYQGRKNPVKRKELNEKVLGEHRKAFQEIFDHANQRLGVFGLKAVEIYRSKVGQAAPPAATRSYVLVSTLGPGHMSQLAQDRSEEEVAEMGLLYVILSIIMMKQSAISEDQLWNSLSRLQLSPEDRHPTFGDVKKLIQDFVTQMYLNKDKVVVGDKHNFTYSWGPRSEAEINKEEMLTFVAEFYEGNVLEQWRRQLSDVLK